MSLYAAKYAVSQIVPYGMTGLTLPGMYISAEALTNAAMLTGYSLTASNMLVMVNDSAAYMTNYNMMSNAMGQNNYQMVKGVSKYGADTVLGMGLS